jgi:hypothetical protein
VEEKHDEPSYQNIPFGVDGKYGTSNVRNKINAWFTGAAAATAENLSDNARLRQFTVKNNATQDLGTGPASASGRTDGLSKPVNVPDPTGLDVAFALSYGEAASFISTSSTLGGATEDSAEAAAANFAKLQTNDGSNPNYDKFWLRSPGTDATDESVLSYNGRVFQAPVDGSAGGGLIYPALWVRTAIFD